MLPRGLKRWENHRLRGLQELANKCREQMRQPKHLRGVTQDALRHALRPWRKAL